MGGLAGHMNHLYDNRDLTFGEMKEIFQSAASGKLDVAEKTDGQNIFISYSIPEGKAKAARNKGNIKTGGMDAAQLATKFAGRGGLTQAFTESFQAFERVAKALSPEEQVAIFGEDANIFYNAEVMDPRSANVINYDKKSLVVHREGHAMFNRRTGEIEDVDVSNNATALENALNQLEQSDQDYRVMMKALRPLKRISDGNVLRMAMGRLDAFMTRNNMKDGNSVGDYIIDKILNIIDSTRIPLTDEQKRMFLKKLYGEKGVKITDVVKGLSPEHKQQIKDIYKDSKLIMKEIIYPLEDIVHDFSVEVLKGMNSAFVMSNKKEVERMRKQVADVIAQLESSGDREAYDFLQKQMAKLKKIENVSTAVEGIVFQHNGNVYKMTGNFAPINQILGFFKYGRKGINEATYIVGEEEETRTLEKKLFFVFGRMNPPTSGHEIMLEEGKLMADSERADYRVYLSKSSDPKKNPLPYDVKIKFFKKLFPRYAPYLIEDPSIRTVIDILKDLNGQYSDVVMLVGEDRVEDFQNLLDRYNGIEYDFETIEVQNTGGRVEGRSGSAMRELVKQGKFDEFASSYSDNIDIGLLRQIFQEIKNGMNINENYLDKIISDEISTILGRIGLTGGRNA